MSKPFPDGMPRAPIRCLCAGDARKLHDYLDKRTQGLMPLVLEDDKLTVPAHDPGLFIAIVDYGVTQNMVSDTCGAQAIRDMEEALR